MSGLITCPDPFVLNIISSVDPPPVPLDERVFPFIVRLSTFHMSTRGRLLTSPPPPGLPLALLSKIGTNPLVTTEALAPASTTPGAFANRSV